MLHTLFDEEKSTNHTIPFVERMRRGSGTFVVLRIRNRADLEQLATILDEPRLRTMQRGETKQIKWHSNADQRNVMGQFFEDVDE